MALGAAALAINLGLLAGLPETAGFEVPMLHLARFLPPALQLFYSGILWAEVYTTAVGNLYGLGARVVGIEPSRFRPFVLGATLVAFLASQVGFSGLVLILYPAVGYAGLAFLGAVGWQMVRGMRQRGAEATDPAGQPEPNVVVGVQPAGPDIEEDGEPVRPR